ncbi:MAG: transporter substrate-binding domain-containing protein [Nitrospira sp.]
MSCSDGKTPSTTERKTETQFPVAKQSESKSEPEAISEVYLEQGDLAALQSRGRLRILVPQRSGSWLPREGRPQDMEQELAAHFARSIKLEPVLVYVKNFEELIPHLIEGKGDLIAANLTVTQSRKQHIAFTVPIDHSREQLISHAKDQSIKRPSDLKNRTVSVQKNTSYEETLNALRQEFPEIKSQVLAGNLDEDEILDKIANKQIDLTILDSNTLEQTALYRSDFNVAINLTNERALAWGIRKDNKQLLKALNRYLNQEQLAKKQESIFLDDFESIKKRKTLRVLTRNNAASYFLWRGELLGFEYELVNAFAKKHKLRLEIIVAPSHEDLIPMLIKGKGDMIAAFMTATNEREAQGITFSRHTHFASEMIVTRPDDTSLNKPEDLSGRSIHVRRSSAYWLTLENLKSQSIKFNLKEAPETMETEEIIAKVASGEYDLTLSDNHILDIELTWREDIKATFSLGEPRKDAWAVREKDTQLLAAINQFIKKEYKGLFYNITYKKYFKNPHKIKKHKQERLDLNPDGSISPYDILVKKYAEQYGFDWRLIVSQMYQESRFDPKARSWAGAKGLMQVMPRTAKELKLTEIEDPETGIHAGVKYMEWVRNRFEPELDVKDRMWFALAAYNAGAGHIKDARRLARQKGWNPNRWFNHVEKALLLLSKRKYAKKARHGYVRGQEPVNYVREIKSRYNAYIRLAQVD